MDDELEDFIRDEQGKSYVSDWLLVDQDLIDRFADKDGCDAAVDYAQELPVRMIAHMMGLPEDAGDLFRKWIHDILVAGITQPAVLMKAIEETTTYFNGQIARCVREPGDDLISYLASVRVDGQPLAPEHILGSLRLILVAGIDTTWSAEGWVGVAGRVVNDGVRQLD